MTLKAWEKNLTPEKIAEIEAIARIAENQREIDESTKWDDYADSYKEEIL